MAVPLRVLLLEDHPGDAELMLHELCCHGFAPDWVRVETEADLVAQLGLPWDLILADYVLPEFDALRALRLLQKRGLDIPVIVVTGQVGEETAVACMKEGAADYLLKDRLARLGPAVARALEEKVLREEKRQAERALADSERKLRGIVEGSPDGIVLTDEQGCVIEWSPAMETITGLGRGDALGRPIWEVIQQLLAPEEDAALRCLALRQSIGNILAMGALPQDGCRRESEGQRCDGTRFVVEQAVFPIRTEKGIMLGAVLRDITDRKVLQDQFLRAQKMEVVGRLAGGVAHDFNNLLTVMIGYATFALDALPWEEPLREDIGQILKAAKRAAGLTKQILAFSRRQVLDPRPININDLILDLNKMLRRLIGENIELVIALAPDLGVVRADAGQIAQAIVNLAVNARDAMPSGGKLTIETANVTIDPVFASQHRGATLGEFVRVTVADTGVGMTEEVKVHLFEPFFTTKEPGLGTGLGLASVYGIVRQHGGHVWVDSAPGQGTRIYLDLPRVAEAAGGLSLREAEELPVGGNETVLVVEDEPFVRNLAARILRDLGYRVLLAANGDEALRLASQEEPIDLLLSDLVMPYMGGQELAEKLLATHPQLRVLFMSGYTQDFELPQRDLHERKIAFLQKPFTAVSLGRCVRQVLDGKAQ